MCLKKHLTPLILVALCILGFLLTLPSHSFGFIAFTEPLLKELSLYRLQYSICYTIGSIMAAIYYPFCGRQYDKYGARATASIGFFLFGLSFYIAGTVLPKTSGFYALLLLTFVFFCLKLIGMGLLETVFRALISTLFFARKTLAFSLVGILNTLWQCTFPAISYCLLKKIHWAQAWEYFGIFLAFCITPLFFFFFKNISPSEGSMSTKSQIQLSSKRSFTVKEALKTSLFWLFALALANISSFASGLAVHLVSVTQECGLSTPTILSAYVQIGFVIVVFELIFGLFADRYSPRFLLFFLLFSQAALIASLPWIRFSSGMAIYMFLNGILWASYSLVRGVAWVHYFGPKFLGEIIGYAMAITAILSPLGPLVFSLSQHFFKTYWVALYFYGSIGVILSLIAFRSKRLQS